MDGDLPFPKSTSESTRSSTIMKHLTDIINIRNERCLQNDGHLRSVKELDRILGGKVLATNLPINGKSDSSTMKICGNNYQASPL